MPFEVPSYFEKGFFAAVGLICTATLGAVGIHINSNKEFKRTIYMRTENLEKEMNEKHLHIVENYPDKDDFKALHTTMTNGFMEIRKDIRLLNNKK